METGEITVVPHRIVASWHQWAAISPDLPIGHNNLTTQWGIVLPPGAGDVTIADHGYQCALACWPSPAGPFDLRMSPVTAMSVSR